jgi:hypothetical protein
MKERSLGKEDTGWQGFKAPSSELFVVHLIHDVDLGLQKMFYEVDWGF